MAEARVQPVPWVWRVSQAGDAWRVESHTGRQTMVKEALLDEHGRLFLVTELGPGIVHSLDMDAAGDAVGRGNWSPRDVRFADLPRALGYRLSPSSGDDERR